MERPNRGRRWANLKQRLGLKGMGCCGGSWSPTSSTLTMIEGFSLSRHGSSRSHREDGARSSAASGMNLAMALAAERNLRTDEGGPTGAGDVKSLMRLFEEMDGGDWKTKRKEIENNRLGYVDVRILVCTTSQSHLISLASFQTKDDE
ncbi:uncharacterized protein LOC120077437 [Benincasa hispida]|uniref:uncharacterized protein LOC120077437 n=1 Tax=Benincasa hispida TaxID=102211 RepID=UPI0018FF11A1|nr:uncharacterized protein LOC120077437 [Benincasa hispida]